MGSPHKYIPILRNNFSGVDNLELRDSLGIQFSGRTSDPADADLAEGRLYYDSSANTFKYYTGAAWSTLSTGSGSGGTGTLDEAYENGATINVDTGAVIFNDATAAAANTVEFNKTGAGSGNVLDFDFTAAFTGNVFNVDFGSAVGAVGLQLDCETGARTGADIQFTSNSSAAHSLIDINESGAGAAIAFDWTGSNNGSPGGQIFLLTFDANDNLTTEVMQIDTGAGARGIMFDFNFAHTDSGTTSHIWDIDVTAVLDSNIFDFATNSACTGNVFFLNLDNGVAMTGLHIEGSGARTQPMVEIDTDATGSSSVITSVITGAISGHLWEISMDTTSTGDVFNVDMNASVGGRCIYIDSGAATRTAALIDILADGDGNSDVFNIDYSNTGAAALFDINSSGAGTGLLFDVDVSGASSGNVVDVAIGAVAYTGDVISIDLGATATGSQAIVITSGAMTRTTTLINIDENGAASGNTIDIDIGAVAYTGNVLDINLGATATGGQAMVVASGAMNRTVALFGISDAGTSSGATFDIDHTGITTGIWFDLDATAATTGNVFDWATNSASTGTIFEINMTNAVGAIVGNYTLAGIRTADAFVILDSSAGAVDVFQFTSTSTSSGHIFNIDIGASLYTGNVIDINLGTTATGSQALVIASGAMARTTALIGISDAGTNSGGAIFDIDSTGVRAGIVFDLDDTAAATGNVFDYATNSASTGTIFNVNMTNAVGAIIGNYTMAGIRTADDFVFTDSSSGATDMFQVTSTSTRSGHVWNIDVDGVFTGNVIDITFATAAATGQAIDLNMGTNVAGMALSINSAGTGVSDEGNAIDIIHSGVLVAGADVARINSSGNCSSTSNALSITMSGAGTAGTNALHINASGTNVEAIEIEEGLLFEATVTANGAGNNETLSTAANVSFYDPNGGSRTGVILTAGLRDGQRVTVVNFADAAEDITFAASGTSNVAGGTACVISQFEARTFIWNSTRSLWYYEIAS